VAGKRVVRSPDGRNWHVRVSRFRPPRFRQSDYEPGADDMLVVLVFEYAWALVVWFAVPVLRALIELPVQFVRALFSTRRWIEARSDDLVAITILWSADRTEAEQAADEVTARLERGYDDLAVPNADLVEMSEPPGLRDLGA
jgi:hypothetical protein